MEHENSLTSIKPVIRDNSPNSILSVLYYNFFYIAVIGLSIAPSLFISSKDNRNFLLISIMIGSMLLLPKIKAYSSIRPLLWLVPCIFIFPAVFHFNNFRLSTIAFSSLFIFFYCISINSLFRDHISYKAYSSLLKYLIYTYFITLLIQQICVLLGLPVFLGSNLSANPWKLNSLSAEPSHTARLVGLLMYSYLEVTGDYTPKHKMLFKSIKKHTLVWIAFLWVMTTTVSGTAFLILTIILLSFLSRRNILIFISSILIIFSIFSTLDIVAFKRFSIFIEALLSLNMENILMADHSASIRILPAVLCIEKINPFSLNGWVGMGIDTTKSWMSSVFPGVPDGFSGGAMANFVLEYGLIIGGLFLFYSFKICYSKNNKFITISFWIICVLLQSINSQQLWCCMLLLFANKYFTNKLL